MSFPRLKATVLTDTLQTAQNLSIRLRVAVQSMILEEEHSFWTMDVEEDGPQLHAEWRFRFVADRETIRQWVQDRVSDPLLTGHLRGIRLSWHRCTHDDPIVQGCRQTNYQEWVR